MANRLEGLMEKAKFRAGSDPAAYNRFHDWSVRDQEGFYRLTLEDIGFPWMKRPSRMLEYDRKDPIWKARWFTGGEANVYNTCIEEQIRRGMGNSPAFMSYREDGRTVRLTYNDVKVGVERIARRLKGHSIKKGDRVCVITTSSEYPYLLFYAIQKIGAVFVPVPTEIMDVALVKRLEMTRPKLIFTLDGFVYGKKLGSARDNLIRAVKELDAKDGFKPEIVEINYVDAPSPPKGAGIVGYKEWLAGKSATKADTEPLQNCDMTMILFTSGTTGTPKGTRHSFCAHMEDMLENAYASNINSGDVSFWFTSPGWMMFPWVVTGANGLGATVVLYDGSPRINGNTTLMKFVQDFGITHLGVSPPIILDIVEALEADPRNREMLKSLKEVRHTSAPLADSIADRLAKFGYHPNGACGGTDGCFCYAGCNPVTMRKGATMVPGLGIDVHVMVSEKGERRDARPGEVGELVIKSPFPSMTMGLLNDDERMTRFRSTYFGYGAGTESKYWLHGDLASFDRQGYLTVHGRADDLLVVHGSKVSPMDVQDAVLRYNPEVSDAAPVSVSLREGDGGELLVFAVLRQGIGKRQLEGLEDRIKDTVKDRVNKLARPYRVFFVGGIPYTINNKPAFRIIKRAFMGEDVGDTSTIRNPESIAEILGLSKSFAASMRK